MKTLSINSFYAPDVKGGAEISLEIIAKGLMARGHRVSVVSLSQAGTSSCEDQGGIEVIRIPVPNLYMPYSYKKTNIIERYIWKLIDHYNPKAQRVLSSLLYRLKPEVVFTHNLAGISVAAWQACRAHNIPIIHVLHDYYLLCPNINMMSGSAVPCKVICSKCKALRHAHKYLSSYVDGVVGVSRSILNSHENAGYFENVKEKHVIYNARDIFAAQTHKPNTRRPITFGFIGGLTPIKGIEQLIEAFKQVDSENIIKLLIAGVGEPAYVQSLQMRACSSQIEFLGYVPSGEFYPHIDVLVVPSLWHEPLGSVIFEGLAHGVPVIGSLRGGTPEIIQDGFNGLLYDPVDNRNLIAAIKRVIDDGKLLREMRDNSIASVANFVSTRRLIDEYEALALRVRASA